MTRFVFLLGCMILSFTTFSQNPKPITIIPQPVSVKPGNGFFKITPNTAIEISSPDKNVQFIADYLSKRLKAPTGYTLKVKTVSGFSKGNIQLRLSGKAGN